jgi:hypothetical protein
VLVSVERPRFPACGPARRREDVAGMSGYTRGMAVLFLFAFSARSTLKLECPLTVLSSFVGEFGLTLRTLQKGVVLLADPFLHDHGVAIGVGAGHADRLVPQRVVALRVAGTGVESLPLFGSTLGKFSRAAFGACHTSSHGAGGLAFRIT